MLRHLLRVMPACIDTCVLHCIVLCCDTGSGVSDASLTQPDLD